MSTSPSVSNFFLKRLQRIVSSYAATAQATGRAKTQCESYVSRLSHYESDISNNAMFTASSVMERGSMKTPLINNSVYTNSFIDMEQVKAIGFDLDYTLVSYTGELQSFIYDQAKQLLLQKYSFPSSLKTCSFDKNFAIRGLSVDARHGLLIKLSNSQRVGSSNAYRGKSQVSNAELKELYGQSRHIPIGDLKSLRPLHDMYSIAEGCLIADAIDHFERRYVRVLCCL
jgi:hypothetical protein